MKGLVYKITNSDESIVYIGSTTESITRRFNRHRYGYEQWISGKADRCHSMIYHSFRDHGIDNFSIHLISEHEIETSRQLCEFEQLVIDRTSCVNKTAAYRTKEQHREMVQQRYQRDKGQILEKTRQYSIVNKEKIKARMSERIACGCGITLSRGNLAPHRRSKKHQRWVEQNE